MPVSAPPVIEKGTTCRSEVVSPERQYPIQAMTVLDALHSLDSSKVSVWVARVREDDEELRYI